MNHITFLPTLNPNNLLERKSEPLTQAEVIAYLDAFKLDNPGIVTREEGITRYIDGFLFDNEDMFELSSNPLENQKIFIGLAKNPKGSFTLVIGAVQEEFDAAGKVIKRTFIHNPTGIPQDPQNHLRRIFDYCDPCPPASPTF
jgi:hypothetical protein